MGLYAELLASTTVQNPARAGTGSTAAATKYGRSIGGASGARGR